MPQLDTVTFLSQLFWLVIIFGTFYLTVLTDILPSFSRVLKSRLKKLKSNKDAIYSLGDEKGETLAGYDKLLSKGLEVSRNSLGNSLSAGDAWVFSSLKDINKEHKLGMPMFKEGISPAYPWMCNYCQFKY